MSTPRRVMVRVMQRIDEQSDGCWVSRYSTGSHGYTQVGWHDGGRRRMTLCHRVAFELAFGEIPDDMTVDHLCRNRRCVNPAHLRLLTNAANGRLNGNAVKTACLRGHPFDEQNTRVDDKGHCRCITCQNDHNAARRRAA